MDDKTAVDQLSKAIGQATKSANFLSVGSISVADPGLVVEGLGPIRLPLKPAKQKFLVAACEVAPFGKGTQTLVDTSVRNTFELDPSKFQLSNEWNAAIIETTRATATQLGLPPDQLEAQLYKLLVYERDGFFQRHRDSEKHDGMVASMIVVLPSPFQGGALIVRHGAVEKKLRFEEAAAGKEPQFAAFYADCEHEVRPVRRGVRLCLAYNLVLKPRVTKSKKAPAGPADALSQTIGSWVAKQPANPLVFALDHHYTERGLALDLLKGADRKLAELIVAAAEKADCVVHLAQVERHLMQHADDGYFERRYYGQPNRSRGAINIGETYEDELSGSQWTDLSGKKQPLGAIAFDLSAIVSAVPIDNWKPTKEEYEGYTGNAGNTLERWYHRSAIVVWHRDHHFDLVASGGPADSIPIFCSMAAKLAKTPKKRFDAARDDCIRLARAILERWPDHTDEYYYSSPKSNSAYDDFPTHLLLLHDRATIATFLMKMVERDRSLCLSSFIPAACREFGWRAFERELTQLIASSPSRFGPKDVPLRDIEWLSAVACDATADPDRTALVGELCALAVGRYCEPPAPRPSYYLSHVKRANSIAEESLPSLLKALVTTGRDDDVSSVLQLVQASPNRFNMDDCQVPSLKSLIPWSRNHTGAVHPQLAAWLDAVRRRLESATAAEPQPPTDWARPANLDCSCRYCGQLKEFLADPANATGRIAAPEERRKHLIVQMRQHQADVSHTLEKKGSPYSLLLKKTTGSYERAVKRYQMDLKLLGGLPVLENASVARGLRAY